MYIQLKHKVTLLQTNTHLHTRNMGTKSIGYAYKETRKQQHAHFIHPMPHTHIHKMKSYLWGDNLQK